MRNFARTIMLLGLLCSLTLPLAFGDLSQDQVRRIDRIFDPLNYPDIPGCAMGVIQDGSLVFAKGYGMASLESGLPNAATTPFHIYSMSKQFTAFCIELLARDGKLSLDDDVRKYLPELPEYGRVITLRHLCNHTAGIRDYLSLISLAGQRNDNYMDEENVLPLLARQKDLNFMPGDQHSYTNSGYLLLSLIVTRVSGLSLREFADKRIFRPLGMKDTHFHDDSSEVVPYRAWGYFSKNNQETVFGLSFEPSNIVMGCGGMMSTVRDLYKWDQNFYHPIVGDATLVREMETPGMLTNGKPCEYGLGLYLSSYRGLRTVSHSGALGAFRSEMVQFPEARFTAMVLANYNAVQPGNYCYRIADICLGDRFTEDATAIMRPANLQFVSLPDSALYDKEGTYRNPETGSTYRFSVRDGSLSLWTRAARFALAPTSETVFVGVNTPTDRFYRFEFVKQPSGGYHVKTLFDGRRNWELAPMYSIPRAPGELAAFAGEYHNEDLGVTCTLFLRDGELYYHQGDDERGPLRPDATEKPEPSDAFRMFGTQVAFFRDAQGQVVGFNLNAPRAANLRFQRVEHAVAQ